MIRSLLLLVLAASLAACAAPEPRDTERRVQPRAVAPQSPATTARDNRRDCLRETGSHLRGMDGCVPVPGQVLTGEDLLRTGAPDLGTALRRATPSIR